MPATQPCLQRTLNKSGRRQKKVQSIFLLANWGFITGLFAHNAGEQAQPSVSGPRAVNWRAGDIGSNYGILIREQKKGEKMIFLCIYYFLCNKGRVLLTAAVSG